MARAKKQVTEESEVKAPEAVISFEDFLAKHSYYHPGLVASFRYEQLNCEHGLEPRTEKEWVVGFEEQSNKTY